MSIANEILVAICVTKSLLPPSGARRIRVGCSGHAFCHLVMPIPRVAMLAKGTTFSCFTEAETALNLLRTSDGHPLRVFNSQTAEDYNKKQLLLKVAGQTVDPNQFKYTYYCVRCVHYGTPHYRGKAISPRPLQRFFAMECKAKVTITYSKISKCLVVKECNLHHNHRIGPEILKHYPSARRLSVEEKQHVNNLYRTKRTCT